MTFFAYLLFNHSIRHSLQSDFIIYIFNSQLDENRASPPPRKAHVFVNLYSPPKMLIYICRLKPRSTLYISSAP